MNNNNREYKLNISPRVLELLGPSLYTNIYYVLAELIANAYDAMASNVYIIKKEDRIIVEDDGIGMSYEDGDIKKYLDVAIETRTTKKDVYTEDGTRKRMGRKGVGKLAALSVSEKVSVMTVKDNEKSGFILSRNVGEDHRLEAIANKDIKFKYIRKNGTSIVMTNPQYGLNATVTAIRNNLLKIFPLVSKDFRIHIITDKDTIIIDNFDKEIIRGLGALITFGKEYQGLAKYFDSGFSKNNEIEGGLLKKDSAVAIPLNLVNRKGEDKKYEVIIKGWVGAYRTTKDRKKDSNDFPDNFISILSNGKLGEYNILPVVGANKLQEVFIVGQLHIDLFEATELPDMSLSNRQGYKTDDLRYIEVIKYVRDELLPRIINMRNVWVQFNKKKKEQQKQEREKKDEEELRKKVDEYKTAASGGATSKIASRFGGSIPAIQRIIRDEMNKFLPIVGIKRRVDSQKKRILISQTLEDKPLSDVIYKMLSFNGLPDEDIIYSNSDNADSRIPNRIGIFEYLRSFFVDSYSDKKMFVIYVTSDHMARSWGAVSEVGAGWITQKDHDIFNIQGHRPQAPLNVSAEWQTSNLVGNNITMSKKEFDKFIVKIIDICNFVGYKPKDKKNNKKELLKYVSIA